MRPQVTLLRYGFALLLLLLASCQGDGEGTPAKSQQRTPTGAKGAGEATTASPGQLGGSSEFNVEDLDSLSTGELVLLAQERRNQNLAEVEELQLLDALNQELCKSVEALRASCPVMRRLIPDATDKQLRCTLAAAQAHKNGQLTAQLVNPSKQKIEVSVPTSKTGSFKLVASGENKTFESSPFGPGTTTITFASTGAAAALAPQFKRIYSLVLRPATDSAAPLPELSGFTFTLSVDGQKVIEQVLEPSDDTALATAKREYKVPLQDIAEIRASSKCLMSGHEVSELKSAISTSLKQQQADDRKEQYMQSLANTPSGAADPSQRQRLIAEILELKTKIVERLPILEGERDRQYRLNNEVKTDGTMGCHAQEPIREFAIELEGSLLSSVYLRTQTNKQPPLLGDGKSSELAFDFGTVKFSLDLASGENPLGGHYIYPRDISNESVIGGLDRVVIRKKGVDYDSLRQCKSNIPIISVWESCEHTINEMNVVTIDAIRVFANGKKVYAAKDLRIRLDHNKAYVALEGFQSNENWIRTMQEQDCNKTN